jgi:hypothetical protein
MTTYYFAAPIAKKDNGSLLCDFDGAVRCESADAAIALADEMARTLGYVAAWAFTRVGDPVSGYHTDVLKRCGSLYWCPQRKAWTT